ncbi:MAG: leucyl aminopeptidase, partial [Solirubrobacterales bacterium]|nr:leucyl aminopeptidase [Solirubrobacterales bacterium]
MKVEITSAPVAEVPADLRVVAISDGAPLPAPLAGAPGAADVKSGFKKATLLRPDADSRWLVVGLGKPADLDAERLRVTAAVAAKAAGRHDATSVAWSVPGGGDAGAWAAALVEGTILASFRFDRFLSADPDDPRPARIETLTLAGVEGDVEPAVELARVAAEAENRARELQSLPANELTPAGLAQRAHELATAHESVEVTVLGREEIDAKGMGGLAAVASGSDAEPRLIALRYTGGGEETLGVVGKGVTFDSGGISIKPAGNMHEMKMDMSGAAVALEAFAAIVELGLPLNLVVVVPSTENMLSGRSMRPGDIISQYNGKTVEINNTDAEGRLILADALAYCVRDMGADRVVDLATLTG